MKEVLRNFPQDRRMSAFKMSAKLTGKVLSCLVQILTEGRFLKCEYSKHMCTFHITPAVWSVPIKAPKNNGREYTPSELSNIYSMSDSCCNNNILNFLYSCLEIISCRRQSDASCDFTPHEVWMWFSLLCVEKAILASHRGKIKEE